MIMQLIIDWASMPHLGSVSQVLIPGCLHTIEDGLLVDNRAEPDETDTEGEREGGEERGRERGGERGREGEKGREGGGEKERRRERGGERGREKERE